MESETSEAFRHRLNGVLVARQDPPIRHLQLIRHSLERLHWSLAHGHEGETPRIPELVGKVSPGRKRGFQIFVVKMDVGSYPAHREHRPPKGIGAKPVHNLQRVNAVTQRLGHLPPLRIPHGSMKEDVPEGGLALEGVPRHDHAGNPKEEDLRRCNQGVPRVEGLEVVGLFGPTENTERPQPR